MRKPRIQLDLDPRPALMLAWTCINASLLVLFLSHWTTGKRSGRVQASAEFEPDSHSLLRPDYLQVDREYNDAFYEIFWIADHKGQCINIISEQCT